MRGQGRWRIELLPLARGAEVDRAVSDHERPVLANTEGVDGGFDSPVGDRYPVRGFASAISDSLHGAQTREESAKIEKLGRAVNTVQITE